MDLVKRIEVNFNLHDLAIAAFRGGDLEEDASQAAEEKHAEIFRKLYDDLIANRIDCFRIFTNGNRINGNERIFHRSPKQAGYIQVSFIWWRNGEMLPTMDEQAGNFDKMLSSCPDNVTVEVFRNDRIKAA